MTKDQDLSSLVEGYQIPLLMDPVQEKVPKVPNPKVNQEQQKQVDLEAKTMLEKCPISKVFLSKGEFLSALFMISKKNGENRPVINLKDLNSSFCTNTTRWKVCTVCSMCCKEGITFTK